jgi:lysophospholipase L1-like esterase
MIARNILTCLFIWWGYNAVAQEVKPFHQGDRVVFTGNSITDGGHYHSYIWLYYMTRFPNQRIDVFNAGIGGDVARQIEERLNTDVFAKNPTVVTLTFGMNDTGYQLLKGNQADAAYQEKITTAQQSFSKIVADLNRYPNVRKVMIGTSPYDETSKMPGMVLKGKNHAMQQIIEIQKNTARAQHWDFVDFNQPMVQINSREQQTDSVFTLQGRDRIHPFNDGHMVMAYLFLKAQGLEGKKVASVAVDAATGKINKSENCILHDLKVRNHKVSFSYQAFALPYPADTVPRGGGAQLHSQADGLKLVPFNENFNQELLVVHHLQDKQNYTVKIDSVIIGQWTGAELSKGVNLAVLHSTPQYQQALAIMHLNEERWSLERRLREYYWLQYSILKPKGLMNQDREAIVDSVAKYSRKDIFVAATLNTYKVARFKQVRDAWQKEMDVLTDQIYKINKPVTHQFVIEPTL